jgi:uncharacterized protein YukE
VSWSQEDPGQGSPDGIDTLALMIGEVADAAASAQANLQKLKDQASDAIWRGPAADAFHSRIDKLPGHLDQLARSYGDARDGFRTYAAAVREIKSKQQAAQSQISQAESDHSAAAHSQASYVPPDAGTSGVTAKNPYDDAVSAAQARLSAATSKLHALADDRKSADSTVTGSLKDAHNDGMKNRSGWSHFWGAVSQVLAVIAIVLIVVAVIAVCVAFPAAIAAFLAADGLLASLAAGGAVLGEAAFGGALGMAMTGVGVASLGTEGILYASGEGSLSHLLLDAALTAGPFALLKGARYLSDVRAASRGLEDAGVAGRSLDDAASASRLELSAAEDGAVKDYSGAAYGRLNAMLRNGDEAAMTGSMKDLSDNLSSALAKLPDYKGMVYRGTTIDDAAAAKYIPGATVSEPAFTSSSTTHPFPGNTQFTIFSSSGKDISGLSSIPNEDEVLFDKGTKFQVLSNDTVNGVRRITLKEVP